MNILFIGPYRQDDEWGRKSRSILKILQKSNHSITSRPIFLSSTNQYNTYQEPSEHIISDKYDILIQFLLQPYAIYTGNIAKKIGIFNTETIPHQIPIAQLTKELLMDEIWTESDRVQTHLQKILDNYNTHTKVITTPPVLDMESLPTTQSLSIKNSDPELLNRFIFYYIGNPLDTKDAFKETLIAYTKTFTNQDSVVLLVLSEPMVEQKELEKVLEDCKNSMGEKRLASQQPMIKIMMPPNGVWTMPERIALHIEADCMVSPSYSVCASSIVLEAALYQSIPIVNKQNAAYHWLKDENVWGIESYEDFCIYKGRPLDYRFTVNELWQKPVVKSLSIAMNTCYIDKLKRDNKRSANAKLRQYFENISYTNILNESKL